MSLGLTDAQLDLMRSQVALLLPGTAVIYTKTAGTATPYGDSYTYNAAGTVSCRVDPLGQQNSTELEYNLSKETTMIMYRCTLPYDATVTADDRITIDGENYEVVQLNVDHSWNVSKRIVIARSE